MYIFYTLITKYGVAGHQGPVTTHKHTVAVFFPEVTSGWARSKLLRIVAASLFTT